MAGAEISPVLEFGLELVVLTVSPLLTATIILAKQKAQAKLNQPKDMSAEIASVHSTLDEFIKLYHAESARGKRFQEALFRSSELSFSALESQTKSIRHLAESVCNGNKKAALDACDEADEFCAQGRAVKNDALIEHTFGGS